MITMQPALAPDVVLAWAEYEYPAEIRWLHGENRVPLGDQVIVSRGPATITPTAIFDVLESTYTWDQVQW